MHSTDIKKSIKTVLSHGITLTSSELQSQTEALLGTEVDYSLYKSALTDLINSKSIYRIFHDDKYYYTSSAREAKRFEIISDTARYKAAYSRDIKISLCGLLLIGLSIFFRIQNRNEEGFGFFIIGLVIVVITYGMAYKHKLDLDECKNFNLTEYENQLKRENEAVQHTLALETQIQNTYYHAISNAHLVQPSDSLKNNTNNVWIGDDKNFCFVEDYNTYFLRAKQHSDANEPVVLLNIPYEQILYYEKIGDITYTTRISGGGGGGSSVKGAIVGGMIAGEAGAIIGSRKKMNEIHSTTEAHDSRQTILYYKKNNSTLTYSMDGFGFYNYLLKKIPEKDLVFLSINSYSDMKAQNTDNSNTSAKERLEQVQKLFDEGLLSEEEFQTKRKEIIQSI